MQKRGNEGVAGSWASLIWRHMELVLMVSKVERGGAAVSVG